jgi:hypothetical protein
MYLLGVEDIPMREFLLKIKDNSDENTDEVIAALNEIVAMQPELTVWDYRFAIDSI